MRAKLLRAARLFAAALSPVGASAEGVSNFSMVGFPIDTRDEAAFTKSLLDYSQTCEVIELDAANRACLQETGEGGQLWLALRESDGALDFVTANPAFVGESQFPVSVQSRVSDAEWEPFEYRLSVTFSELEIPLLVEIADPRDAAQFANMTEPKAMTLDLTAFVFEPEFFASEDAFTKAQIDAGEEVVMASNFFIPSGLFGETPTAHADFAGKILKVEKRNPKGGAPYWLALAEVLDGATVNVVFDATGIKRKPKVGQLIVGEFWLSAQIRK